MQHPDVPTTSAGALADAGPSRRTRRAIGIASLSALTIGIVVAAGDNPAGATGSACVATAP